VIEVHAVVGVLRDTHGRYLVAQRPSDKISPGKWEFPGGKVESPEQPEQALAREMLEEIGIQVINARPVLQLRNRFPERLVFLDVWHVLEWQGLPHGAEGQSVRWIEQAETGDYDFLPGVEKIMLAIEQAKSP